ALPIFVPLAIIIHTAFNIFDYAAYPLLSSTFFKMRLFTSLIMLIFILLTFFKKARRYILWYINISAFLLSFDVLLMAYLNKGFHSYYYSGINLIFLGLCFINPFYYANNFIFCISQIIIYDLVTFANGHNVNLTDFCFTNYFLFFTALFIVLLSEFSGSQHYNAFVREHERGKLIKELEDDQELLKMREQEIIDAYARLKGIQEQLIQSEKLNTIGQLASGIAHEVRNPLAIVLQGINYLETKINNRGEEVAATLASLKESIKRADRIINTLLDFSKAKTLDLQLEDIKSILEESLDLLKNQFERKSIEIVFDVKNDISMIMVDKNRLQQVFINVLLNAIQAMPKGGKIVIRAYEIDGKGAEDNIERKEDALQAGEKAVRVEIEDTGIGIPEENLNRVFEPFFTTKGPRGGTGLGLSVSRNILAMHKGSIAIKSKPGKGTKVIITLRTNL
ncbi:MAG: ATP-binding protein, partial [Candidatus Omnitrophica bacterium]|nr:ATP-binding protein [Candidatus Omnitrophota bacterium]